MFICRSQSGSACEFLFRLTLLYETSEKVFRSVKCLKIGVWRGGELSQHLGSHGHHYSLFYIQQDFPCLNRTLQQCNNMKLFYHEMWEQECFSDHLSFYLEPGSPGYWGWCDNEIWAPAPRPGARRSQCGPRVTGDIIMYAACLDLSIVTRVFSFFYRHCQMLSHYNDS